MREQQVVSRSRPAGVWVVFLFYLLSAGSMLASFALIAGGKIDIPPAQEAYFASLTPVDWFFTVAIGACGLTAAVCFFLLKRVAVALFVVALILNVALTAFQVVRTNWTEALGGSGLLGVLGGWSILVAVVLYARGLDKRRVLS